MQRQPFQQLPPAAQVAQSSLAYQQARADLLTTQASLTRLDAQAQQARQQAAAAEQSAAEDRRKESDLRRQIGEMARSASVFHPISQLPKGRAQQKLAEQSQIARCQLLVASCPLRVVSG